MADCKVFFQSELLINSLLSGTYRTCQGLLEQGADPNVEIEGVTPFHVAVGVEGEADQFTKLLIQNGADPNIRSLDGVTPLHVALIYDKCDVVKILLQNGANPLIKDQDDEDALSKTQCQVCRTLINFHLAEDDDDLEEEDEDDQQGVLEVISLTSDPSLPEPYSACDMMVTPPSMRSSSSSSYQSCDLMLLSQGMPSSSKCSFTPSLVQKINMSGCVISRLNKSCVEAGQKVEIPPGTGNHSPDGSDESSFHTAESHEPELEISGIKKLEDSHLTIMDEPFGVDGQYRYAEYTDSSNGDSDSPIYGTIITPMPSDSEEDKPASVSQVKVTDMRGLVVLDPLDSDAFLPSEYDSHDLSFNSSQTSDLKNSTFKKLSTKVRVNRSQQYPIRDVVKEHSPSSTLLQKLHHLQVSSCSRGKGRCHEVMSRSSRWSVFTSDSSDLEVIINNGSHSAGKEKNDPQKEAESTRNKPQKEAESMRNKPQKEAESWRNKPQEAESWRNKPEKEAESQRNKRQEAESWRNKPQEAKSWRNKPQEAESSGRWLMYNTPGVDRHLVQRTESWSPNLSGVSTVSASKAPRTSSRNGTQEFELDFPSFSTIRSKDVSSSRCRLPSDSVSRMNKPKPNQSKSADSSSQNQTLLYIPVGPEIRRLDGKALQAELKALGEHPGPVTSSTRSLYETRLAYLRAHPQPVRKHPDQVEVYPVELTQALRGSLDMSLLQDLEDDMALAFTDPNPTRHWREGTKKSSFNYLLLDPRITKNLPSRVNHIGLAAAFQVFVKSIIYVGKGKRSRPYSHFKEAMKHIQNPVNQPSCKVARILDIWNEGLGVVSLHIYHNVIPVEAYTREACMIDAVGISHLTNVKLGDHYGMVNTWPIRKRRLLGVRLIQKAFRIFLSEGERQIRPSDIQG